MKTEIENKILHDEVEELFASYTPSSSPKYKEQMESLIQSMPAPELPVMFDEENIDLFSDLI